MAGGRSQILLLCMPFLFRLRFFTVIAFLLVVHDMKAYSHGHSRWLWLPTACIPYSGFLHSVITRIALLSFTGKKENTHRTQELEGRAPPPVFFLLSLLYFYHRRATPHCHYLLTAPASRPSHSESPAPGYYQHSSYAAIPAIVVPAHRPRLVSMGKGKVVLHLVPKEKKCGGGGDHTQL